MSKKKTGWQTFETKPEVGEWINVYAVNKHGTYWIGNFEWMGSYLRERGWGIPSALAPLLWRPYPSEPSEKLVARARGVTAAYGAPEIIDDAPAGDVAPTDDDDWLPVVYRTSKKEQEYANRIAVRLTVAAEEQAAGRLGPLTEEIIASWADDANGPAE